MNNTEAFIRCQTETTNIVILQCLAFCWGSFSVHICLALRSRCTEPDALLKGSIIFGEIMVKLKIQIVYDHTSGTNIDVPTSNLYGCVLKWNTVHSEIIAIFEE